MSIYRVIRFESFASIEHSEITIRRSKIFRRETRMASIDSEVFTPELLELLTRLMSDATLENAQDPTSAVSPVSNEASDYMKEPLLGPSRSIESIETAVSAESPPQISTGGTHNTVSPTSESLGSMETAASGMGFQLSPNGKNKPAFGGGYRSSEFYPRNMMPITSAPTTLMLKNIPNRITREMLAEEIMSKMPVGSFDFLYLPIDFNSRAGFGYAFINCTSDENVDLFVSEFHKRRLNCSEGSYSKPVEVTIARVQGFTANINRLISSPVLFSADEGSLPLIFNSNQVPIPFKALMQLNRASILFQQRPSIDELILMVEQEMYGSTESGEDIAVGY